MIAYAMVNYIQRLRSDDGDGLYAGSFQLRAVPAFRFKEPLINPRVVAMVTLGTEIKEWCIDSFDFDQFEVWDNAWGEYIFHIQREVDAVLFKLRWFP